MTDVDDLDLDVEETDTEPDTADTGGPEERLAALEGKLEKARSENHSLRTRLRRTEWQAEYGTDLLEVVPENLPLREQKKLLDNLKAKFGERVEPGTETGTTDEASPPEETPSSSAEKAMAAVVKDTGNPTALGSKISHEQYREMVTNPETHEKAIQMRQAGLVTDD